MSDIVNRLWGYCHVLRAEGADYADYVEEIGYLLFLKMAEERGVTLPDHARWKRLVEHDPRTIVGAYRESLHRMSEQPGMLGLIEHDRRDESS